MQATCKTLLKFHYLILFLSGVHKMRSEFLFHCCRAIAIGVFMLLAARCESASAQATGKDGVDDVQGARWHYEITHGDAKKPIEKGVFRVYKKVIYKGKTKVGVVNAESPKSTHLKIDGLPEINGSAELKKVGEKPPIWEGTLERKNGKHFQMRVEFRDG